MFDTRRRNKKLDEQLFLCTAVLSSLMVYNTTGSVDENGKNIASQITQVS
jgi:hypothetical protein